METRYVIVKPGVPCQILDPLKVHVRVLTDFTEPIDPVFQDVTGWIAMPEEHWNRIKPILESHK